MIAAIVVLYQPNLAVLERLLFSIQGQVDRIIVVDNTPRPLGGIGNLLEAFQESHCYIPLGGNTGIAAAQNVGILESMRSGCSHVLLLDQDSCLPSGMVDALLRAEEWLSHAGVRVAAVGPQFLDEKTGVGSWAIHHRLLRVRRVDLDPRDRTPVETDNLIASGSIIQVETLKRIGMMRDDLFIDFVDTEWGLRARQMGYKSFCIPDVVMRHSIGDRSIRLLGKDVYLHSDVRDYYRLRNAIYLLRVRSMGWHWKSYIIPRIPYYFLLYLFFSTKKLSKVRILLRAVRDGILGNMGKLPSEWIES